MFKLVFDGIFGFDNFFAVAHARKRAGQAVIGLRSDNQIDIGRTAQNFLTFCLRNATGNTDGQLLAIWSACILHLAQATQR